MPTTDRSNITVEHRFDVNCDITEDWFRFYVTELAKYSGHDRDDVQCDIRLGSDFDNRVGFRNRQAWIDYVTEHWIDVAETSIWQHGGLVRRGLCNHRRHHVTLMLVADNIVDIEGTFELLRESLSLSISPENPYWYRRSSLEFEIGSWRPDWFVDGITAIAALLGPAPDVSQAWAKSFEGDIEKLTPFSTLKSFCENVGVRASRFGEIAIRMQARSMGIGIGVTSDHKKLRIRTSLPPEKTDPLIDAWSDKLKLKAIKAADTGAEVSGGAPPPTASENPWLKYGIPVVVAFVTAASVAGLIGLKKAIWPDYKVTITSPFAQNGVAKWSGNAVSIDWYLQPDQPSFRAIKKNVIARVKVYAPSGSQPPIESKPPISVSLEPGSYVVSVDAPDAAPAQFQLVVENTGERIHNPLPYNAWRQQRCATLRKRAQDTFLKL